MPMRRAVCLIGWLLVLGSGPAFAQSSDAVATTEASASAASADEDAAARAHYEATVAALGGDAFLYLRSQTTQAYGAITPPGTTQEMRFESMKTYELLPHKNRVEFSLSSGSIVQAYNGDVGWLFIGGRLIDISEEQREQSRYGTHMLRAFDPTSHTLSALPDTVIQERPAVGFAITDPEGYTTAFYVDAETHLPLQMAYTLQGVQREEYFSSYEARDGLQIPFHIEVYQAGQQVLRTTLEDVQINPALDPALFDIPPH